MSEPRQSSVQYRATVNHAMMALEAEKYGEAWLALKSLDRELESAEVGEDRLLRAIEAAIDALGPGDAEDTDSPGHMAFAILNHARAM